MDQWISEPTTQEVLMTQDNFGQNLITQSDLKWLRIAVDKVWMSQYDFRWVRTTIVAPFWGPLDAW